MLKIAYEFLWDNNYMINIPGGTGCKKQAMIATQNLAYNSPPPLLTLPTQYTTATHPAPSPIHYHTQHPTQYLTTHPTTIPLYPNPPH